MVLPVLVEPTDGGFRAVAGSPLMFSAEGATRDEALDRLRAEIRRKLSEGTLLLSMEIPPPEEDSWVKHAGIFRDDLVFDDWVDAMAEYRRSVDEEDERREQEAARG